MGKIVNTDDIMTELCQHCDSHIEMCEDCGMKEILKGIPSAWIKCSERLPEESGEYIAYIREPLKIQKSEFEKEYNFSYVTTMGFEKGKMLWSDGHEDAYNAALSVVDTDQEFHVTHWMPLPDAPEVEG